MKNWLFQVELCEILLNFPKYKVFLTDLKSVKLFVVVLCNAHQRYALLLRLLYWLLLSSAAREMYTCTLAGYVITR